MFIKKGFRTREQINFLHALIPAYLSAVLAIVLAFIPQDNTDLVKIQNQLELIQQTASETENLEKIEKLLEDIYKKDFDDSQIVKILKELLEKFDENIQ